MLVKIEAELKVYRNSESLRKILLFNVKPKHFGPPFTHWATSCNTPRVSARMHVSSPDEWIGVKGHYMGTKLANENFVLVPSKKWASKAWYQCIHPSTMQRLFSPEELIDH